MEKQRKGNSESYKLIIQPFYFESLEKIVDYIANVKNEPLNAIKVGRGINKAMKKIVHNPTSYSECENLPTKSKIYREARFKSWLIIFKIQNFEVTILGVLNGRQKLSTFKKLKNNS